MDIVYAMPNQAHRLFINVVNACPNACYFCVDFKGDTFYGFNLKGTDLPSAAAIVEAVKNYPLRESVTEVYYCGIGEPLLRYSVVVETGIEIRRLLPSRTILAVNTSGTFFKYHQRVDIAQYFDLIQVSLNAENEEKYKLICRPKIDGAYQYLHSFLRELRRFIDKHCLACRVELSVVDTSDSIYLPEQGQTHPSLPKPDIDACRKIAASYGWPLKVKKLLEDYERDSWDYFAERVRGNSLNRQQVNLISDSVSVVTA